MTPEVATALHDRLWTFVRRRVGSDPDADDVVQDVFLRMTKRVDDLRDDTALTGWAYAIARNAIVDHYRAGKHDGEPLTDVPIAPEADPESVEAQLVPCVRAMLLGVPEPYREALELTDLGGLSQAQASDELGLSRSGMRTRVQRGRAKLRESIEACCRIELDRRGGVMGAQCRSCDWEA